MTRLPRRVVAMVATVSALGACAHQPVAPRPNTATPLKQAFSDAFRIGAALNDAQFEERDTIGAALTKTHFNTITSENVLKWALVHPSPGVYDFAAPDKYVAFGERNGMTIIGHTLVWHNQTPQWVFQDAAGNPVSRDTLLQRLHDHIRTVVGRYRGRITGWDVVNEAVDEDGSLRKTPWLQIIGEDYLVKAFEWAREADPQAELYYNDYSVENAPKRNGVIALVKRLQAAGVRVTAVGLQGHDRLDWPTVEQQDTTIAAFAALGVGVNITELDIDVLPRVAQRVTADVSLNVRAADALDPYKSGLPDSVQQALARRYADLFMVFLKHRKVIERVTFWGVRDGDSWLNNWPVRGRTSYPLLFDRAGRPKPAFDAVIQAAKRSAVVQ
jgi:endo-1,4-beta-xylanase